MKRYLVFAFDTYQEIGGWGDFQSDHDEPEEALVAAKKLRERWDQVFVVDLETKKEIML